MAKLTVKKLKAIAKEKGISTRHMAKKDILAKLKKKLCDGDLVICNGDSYLLIIMIT